MSRLQFHCQVCDLKGSRDLSYVELPDNEPSFIDICPRCQSDDVEVLDGELAELTAPRKEYKDDGGYQEPEKADDQPN